jgi:hypothetical protein
MSEAEMFQQYAEEAMRWASESNTEQETRTLIELVCTWTLAATESERAVRNAACRNLKIPRRQDFY